MTPFRNNTLRSLIHTGDCFYGTDGTWVYSSLDAISWNRITLIGSQLVDIAYANGILVVISLTGVIHCWNENSNEWSKPSIPMDPNTYYSLNRIVYANGNFVIGGAVSYKSGGIGFTHNLVLKSSDGYQWTKSNTQMGKGINDLLFNNSTWIGVGGRGIYTSSDLDTWTLRENVGANTICYGNNSYLVFNTKELLTSFDAMTWTKTLTPNSYPSPWRMCFFKNKFYMISNKVNGSTAQHRIGNKVYTSNNGINWGALSGVPNDLNGFITFNSKLYGYGFSETALNQIAS